MAAHPIASFVPEVMGQTSQCSMPSQKSYSAHQVSTGAFLRDIVEHDINSPIALHHLVKYYTNYYLDIILYMMLGINCLVKFHDATSNNVLTYSGSLTLEGQLGHSQ